MTLDRHRDGGWAKKATGEARVPHAGLILDTAFVASLGVVCPPDSADDIEVRPFDPCDVPRDRFVTAGLAWRGVRAGGMDPAWGISRGMSPRTTIDEVVATRLDALAALTAQPEPDWRTLRETYDREELFRVPPVVMSFPKGRPTEVAVSAQ